MYKRKNFGGRYFDTESIAPRLVKCMGIKELESIIEAILFAVGDEVHIDTLSDVIDVDKKLKICN